MVRVDLGRIAVVHTEHEARRIIRAIRSLRPCDALTSVEDVVAHLTRGPRVCGVVAAAHLRDGEGVSALEYIRDAIGNVPALLLVDDVNDSTMASAYERRAALLPRAVTEQQLRRFALDCVVADFEPDEAVRAALLEIASRYRLTEVEIETVHGALHGHRADWFLRERRVSAAAYKARVASVLRKTMGDDVSSLVREILWLALQRDVEGGRR